MQSVHKTRRGGQGGFSILEMMFATLILLVGLVAVAQLVPASILLNNRNRTDTSSLVFAQRELDQMLVQSINVPFFTDYENNLVYLGNPAQPNQVVGAPVVTLGNLALIDFTASPVSNYSFTYQDPNDPGGTQYDVRWAVITSVNNSGAITSKRIILGVRQQGGNGYYQPVTLDTMTER